MAAKSDEKFSPKESEDRMRAALKGARIAGHKSMKDIAPKRESKKKNSKPKSSRS